MLGKEDKHDRYKVINAEKKDKHDRYKVINAGNNAFHIS